MGYQVRFKKKEEYGGLKSLSIWCYEIVKIQSRQEEPDLREGDWWGLDFPAEIQIQNWNNYAGVRPYKLITDETSDVPRWKAPAGKKIVAVELSENLGRVDICFVGPSGEDLEVEISLEYFNEGQDEWQSLEFLGEQKFIGPTPISMAPGEKGKEGTKAKKKKKRKKKKGEVDKQQSNPNAATKLD